MRTFIASKLAVTAILTLFTLAFAWNLVQGSGLTRRGHSLPEAETVLVSHGPGIPPDPWEGVRLS